MLTTHNHPNTNMDSSGSSTSGQRRLSSRRSDRSLSRSNSEDGYDLDEFTVADGFRPSNSEPSIPPPSESPQSSLKLRSESPVPSVASASSSNPQNSTNSTATAAIPAPEAMLEGNPAPFRPRPSSVSKQLRPHDSFTLANDGSHAASTTHYTPSHPSNLGSNTPDGLFTTSSAPSQQSHVSPPTSISGAAPSSQPAHDQIYNRPRGPTHPYTLYPQSTEPSEASNHHIPVGFSSLGRNYQRQIGPDGEEAGDLVGPMGHLEELPPYTRYPEPAYVRDVSSASPATESPVSAVTPQVSLPGSGGIGIATRNPEFSSTENTSAASQSQPSVHSGEISDHEVNTAATDFAEKEPIGKWQRRARKKLWGVVPYWSICLLAFGAVIVGVVMGTVMGRILLKKKDNTDDDDDDNNGIAFGQIPTGADVQPLITLPSSLAPLAIGLFDLPPLDVSQAPRSCFNDTTQSQAWSCEMPFRYYSMQVGMIQDAKDVEKYEMSLTAVNGSEAIYVWGTQPPNIYDPVPLTLVNDSFELSRGPAWWRKIQYDKVVIVSENSFSPPTKHKRQWTYDGPPLASYNHMFRSASPGPVDGERPWFCTWPNTTMEIFIYPSQNASQHSPASVGSLPSTTSVFPTSVTDYPDADYTPTPNDPTPAYPQVVKFLERRLFMDDDDTAATCRQVQIVNDGKDKIDVLDDGEPVEVVVVERARNLEELLEAQQRSRHIDRPVIEYLHEQKRETLELTDCGCLWWSV